MRLFSLALAYPVASHTLNVLPRVWAAVARRRLRSVPGRGIGRPRQPGVRLSPDGQIVIWGAVVDPDPLNPGVNWVPPGRFKQVATGWTFTLFLVSAEDPLEDGKIIARGSMWPSTGTPGTPTGPGHKAVAAGYNHALAIDQNDEIVAWGNADAAALRPGRVPPDLQGAKALAIAAGENLSAAILLEDVTKASASAGDIVVWGMSEAHYAGTIGVPGSYSVLAGPFTELAAHGHHLIARRESGGAVCVGNEPLPLRAHG